jgi:hypothetical protein
VTLEPEKIAERLGATHFAELPDVGGGAFGMAQLAKRLKERLDARGARRPGTGVGWIMNSKVPMSAETERLLIALAEKLTTPEQRVNPLQLAGQLLEESVRKLAQEKTQ